MTINKNQDIKSEHVVKKRVLTRHKSVLERYYEHGYLELSNSKYSALDRKKVGEKLALDYFLGEFYQLKSAKLQVTNIKNSQNFSIEQCLFFKDRYLKAMKNIPYEFWEVVRKVCIEDKELTGEKQFKRKSLLNKNSIYHQKMLLNLGLERLIIFYLKKNKKSS